jgi:hypothetical protein
MDTTPNPGRERLAQLKYTQAILQELARMAQADQENMLAYLIEMAAIEAGRLHVALAANQTKPEIRPRHNA